MALWLALPYEEIRQWEVDQEVVGYILHSWNFTSFIISLDIGFSWGLTSGGYDDVGEEHVPDGSDHEDDAVDDETCYPESDD